MTPNPFLTSATAPHILFFKHQTPPIFCKRRTFFIQEVKETYTTENFKALDNLPERSSEQPTPTHPKRMSLPSFLQRQKKFFLDLGKKTKDFSFFFSTCCFFSPDKLTGYQYQKKIVSAFCFYLSENKKKTLGRTY